ncbi:hypothetical protein DRN86_03855 [Candidatus Geothermarchaeota archaeon]|nr:MAG: hypothetical protein DRN86_03855 [Candidatus Geothermarchaeota archaeon]
MPYAAVIYSINWDAKIATIWQVIIAETREEAERRGKRALQLLQEDKFPGEYYWLSIINDGHIEIEDDECGDHITLKMAILESD